MVLPHLWFKSLGSFGDASFIFFAVVISAIAATSMCGEFLIDTFTAITEDAVPVRGKPGQIAFKDLRGVLWIRKLHPFAGESGCNL
jgi:hypothetical protein